MSDGQRRHHGRYPALHAARSPGTDHDIDLLLDPFDHDRATQAITLGVVFGAVVGLLADMLKVGAAAGQQPAGGATITLGASALALLAGYSAGQVFGLLDDISERVFGRRDAPGRAPGA